MPHDTYCGACGAPLRGSRRKAEGAFATAADDFLPLRVPEEPRTQPRRALRIASSAVAIGLVVIMGLGALAVAMNQLDETDGVSPTVSSLHRYGAQVTTGGDGAVQGVGIVAERTHAAASDTASARSAGRARATTHLVSADAPIAAMHSRAAGRVRGAMHHVSVEAPVAATGERAAPATDVADFGAKGVATAATRGQMAIAKAPMTRSHPGDGTGGVMVMPPGDGTGGFTLLKAP